MSLELKEITIDKPVEICNNHVIILLENFKKGNISKHTLLDWVNTVWFSGLFEYCDENCDSIASVMNELEEIDENGKELTYEKIKRYIYALKNNIEII
ncbi:hypothetical protein SPSYN_02687 [Sporotomaculum syntrophicum]|uniref:Uncharacterized protein n=1 Tax=Sporotomaculum syntrophicum TaxID=182264 RepID=A0A9D3AY16_9FIRM|nr:hypothetical protein [Sporotomaculum syntrophicum]KAF1084283.1 hypothetical protein SPSYN_02687 [Sporotomaculum syntrophicum]